MALARLASTSLDCADPQPLADFWAQLLGGEVAFSSDGFSAVRTPHGWVTAVRVDDYRPPTWPDPGVPKQVHLDLAVTDLDAAEAAAVDLGARRAEHQPSPGQWRVLIDPAGHPFCLTTLVPD